MTRVTWASMGHCPMRRLAVIHHRHLDWVPNLAAAEPQLEVRGWHPRDLGSLDPADMAWLSQAEGLFCWKLPPNLMAHMPHLAWVQNSGAGVDHLIAHPDLPTHIPISRADGHFGHWMARYVCGHLLARSQRLEECRAAQAQAQWNPKLLPEDLRNQKALVVGFGRIGRCIGEALRALGLEVHGVVREVRPDPEFTLLSTQDLAAALPTARLLVLAAPLTSETRNLVDAELLRHGHGSLTLINVGRGELVAVEALLEALDQGRLGHAVLDVFPEEPLPSTSPLWAHPKVTITPHHSGPSTPSDLIPDILPNLRRFADRVPIQDTVDRRRGY